MRGSIARMGVVVGIAACSSFGTNGGSPTPEPDAGGPDASPDVVEQPVNDGGSEAAPPTTNKLVFVTTKTVKTDPTPDALIGSADLLCKTEAEAAGYTDRKFVAWLSSTSQDAIQRVIGTGSWAVPGSNTSAELVVFVDRTAIFTSTLAAPINRGANGSPAPNVPTFTGTMADGTRAPSTCANWSSTSSQDVATGGSPNETTGKWTDDPLGRPACNSGRSVYCFETE